MTRQKWTTKEQQKWLEERKQGFIDANQHKQAAKTFFPVILKEFCDRWPVPPCTPEEIHEAQTEAMAMRVKRGLYEKRIMFWFHNNARSISASSSTRAILKVTPKGNPRKIQAWQAYQHLTYQTLWKPRVEQEWKEYKRKWEAENSAPIPRGRRLQFQMEFMKARLAEETEPMIKATEEYRRLRAITPELTDADKKNLEYQKAINMLPRTLASITESLREQTGWNITIMAGGPSPNEGAIMSYISHGGKTKTGESFEEFLGPKVFDATLLEPFDRFLHASFTNEDCAARSLDKAESTGSDHLGSEDCKDEEGSVADLDEEDREEGKDEDVSKIVSVQPKRSEYEISRENNIAYLKEKMNELNEQFKLPPKLLAPPQKEKKTTEKGKKQERIVERRESQRHKNSPATVDQVDLTVSDDGKGISSDVGIAATSPAPAAPAPSPPAAPAPHLPSEDIQMQSPAATSLAFVPHNSQPTPALPNSPEVPQRPSLESQDSHQNSPAAAVPAGTPPVSQPLRALVPISPAPATVSHLTTSNSQSSENTVPLAAPTPTSPSRVSHRPSDTSTTGAPPVTPSCVTQQNSAVAAIFVNVINSSLSLTKSSPAKESPTKSQHPNTTSEPKHIDSANTLSGDNPKFDNSISPADPPTNSSPARSVDVTSIDIPAIQQLSADAFPAWLTKLNMADYLLGVAEESAWHDLLKVFVNFEKICNQNGNLPTKNHPREISDWIKSKKKQVVPSLKPGEYGTRFMDWWKSMQPSWRTSKLIREVPEHESWTFLKKGGSAGIYVAIVGLLWWVKCQHEQHDTETWSLVDDLTWVIKEMSNQTVKRVRDEEEDSEDRPGKRLRVI